MEEADAINKRRLEIWANYHQWFASLEKAEKIRRPVVPRECAHNAHMYYLLLPSLERRTATIARLKSQGIQTVFHYVPLHSSPQGLALGRTAGPMTHTDSVSDRLLRLPLWLGLEDSLADVIAEIIAAAQ